MATSSATVFVASCDPGNFDRTVRNPVEIDGDDAPDELESLGPIRLWGVSDGTRNRSYFESMQPGDLVLFYGDDSYVGTGWIETTVEDDTGWANESFWDDGPSTMLYTVEGFSEVAVPKAAVNRIFDYDESYTPQGLLRVADRRVSNNPEAIKLAVERFDERD